MIKHFWQNVNPGEEHTKLSWHSSISLNIFENLNLKIKKTHVDN